MSDFYPPFFGPGPARPHPYRFAACGIMKMETVGSLVLFFFLVRVWGVTCMANPKLDPISHSQLSLKKRRENCNVLSNSSALFLF